MIRAAIVGIGHWGRILVRAVQGKSSAIQFVAGYNRTRANAEAFCAEHKIGLADDLDALLSGPVVDAVVFATPHRQHGAQVERAAAAGKHVLMEKPFTLDVESAEAALAAAARAGIVLGVAYPRRFHPAMRELKARLDTGRLGALSHCESTQTSPAGIGMSPDYWRSDPEEAPAGAMTATGVHNLDALIYLFGRIDEVYCLTRRRAMARLDDTTTVLLGLENGMSATLYCSLVTAPAYRFTVYGTEGHVEIAGRDFEFRFTPTTARPSDGRHIPAAPEIITYPGFDAIAAELEGFAAAVEGRSPYPITAEEIRHGVAAFEALVRSAELHRPVKVAR